jgi:citrate synthase
MDYIKNKKKIGNLGDPRMPYDYSKREYGTVPMDTAREPFRWVSEVAYKNVHRIVARGYDTTELAELGYGIVDMLFIDFQSRIPTLEEEKMLNYILILSLEEGLSMPAALSRIVAKSKTFLTQACGASILAFGHAYGAFSSFGNMLIKYLDRAEKEGKTVEEIAEILVKEKTGDEALGVSNLMLKDQAAKRMLKQAEKLGVADKYCNFMKYIVKVAKKISSESVDLDMLGATGAVMMDLGFSPEAIWAIIAVTRSFGAGAHFIEEIESENYIRYGQTLTPKEDYYGHEDRLVPPLEERDKIAKPAQTHTPDEWKKAFTERQKIPGSGFSIIEEIEDPSKKTGV